MTEAVVSTQSTGEISSMAYWLWLLSLLFSLSVSWPIQLNNVSLDQLVTGTFKINLQTVARLEVHYKGPITICFQAFVQTPFPTRCNPRTCTFFFNLTYPPPNNSTLVLNYKSDDIKFRDLPYFYSIHSSRPNSKIHHLSLSGPSCVSGAHFNGKNCTTLTIGKIYPGVLLTSGGWYLFHVEPNWGSFTLSLDIDVMMVVRWKASPYQDLNDGSSGINAEYGVLECRVDLHHRCGDTKFYWDVQCLCEACSRDATT
eukprot:TRINITY_DN11559_c0_g1_i2.p1 TRINITY_DN11559_c0_g1~~TRINITY_DN11559_c0_g1_i2.p1  ORF type:complete len:256 (-),score=42.53 TRINITY_DN11559_c0_g1_i2:509-1276(-)